MAAAAPRPRSRRHSIAMTTPAKYHAPDSYYELKQLLGQGNFAEVWRAADKLGQRKMAVKLYKKRSMKHDHIQMLVKQEVDVMKAVASPNCIKLLDVHDTYRGRHLVMEYATGGSLFAYARKHKYLVEKEAQEVFRQVCRGVAAMHHANACHRDIKMENILFGDDKLLKLADFGLAVLLAEPEKKLNDICGSLLYMAPEILLKKKYLGRPVDIWSLGVMLFVLLCGEFPFMGNSENDVIRVISTGRPNWQPLVTAPAKDLITKMLAKKPEDRLSIDEVLAHPWLALPEGAPTESQPFVKSSRKKYERPAMPAVRNRRRTEEPQVLSDAAKRAKAAQAAQRKEAQARRSRRRSMADAGSRSDTDGNLQVLMETPNSTASGTGGGRRSRSRSRSRSNSITSTSNSTSNSTSGTAAGGNSGAAQARASARAAARANRQAEAEKARERRRSRSGSGADGGGGGGGGGGGSGGRPRSGARRRSGASSTATPSPNTTAAAAATTTPKPAAAAANPATAKKKPVERKRSGAKPISTSRFARLSDMDTDTQAGGGSGSRSRSSGGQPLTATTSAGARRRSNTSDAGGAAGGLRATSSTGSKSSTASGSARALARRRADEKYQAGGMKFMPGRAALYRPPSSNDLPAVLLDRSGNPLPSYLQPTASSRRHGSRIHQPHSARRLSAPAMTPELMELARASVAAASTATAPDAQGNTDADTSAGAGGADGGGGEGGDVVSDATVTLGVVATTPSSQANALGTDVAELLDDMPSSGFSFRLAGGVRGDTAKPAPVPALATSSAAAAGGTTASGAGAEAPSGSVSARGKVKLQPLPHTPRTEAAVDPLTKSPKRQTLDSLPTNNNNNNNSNSAATPTSPAPATQSGGDSAATTTTTATTSTSAPKTPAGRPDANGRRVRRPSTQQQAAAAPNTAKAGPDETQGAAPTAAASAASGESNQVATAAPSTSGGDATSAVVETPAGAAGAGDGGDKSADGVDTASTAAAAASAAAASVTSSAISAAMSSATVAAATGAASGAAGADSKVPRTPVQAPPANAQTRTRPGAKRLFDAQAGTQSAEAAVATPAVAAPAPDQMPMLGENAVDQQS